MESIGADLRQMQRTPLAASHVQALRDAGKTVTHPVGAILARSGEPITSFVYLCLRQYSVSLCMCGGRLGCLDDLRYHLGKHKN
jgi:thioredoxin reductase (NADPH)